MLKFKNVVQVFLLSCLLSIGVAQADQLQTEQTLTHHLESFGAGDIPAIMSDYADNAVVFLPNGILKGKAEITGLFDALVAEFGQEGVVFNLKHSAVDDEVAYIIWNAETPNNSYTFATDTFLVKDGKIMVQTIAFNAVPKS